MQSIADLQERQRMKQDDKERDAQYIAPVPSAAELHHRVPPDWYHRSIRSNLLQRYWHTRRFREISRLLHPVDGEILDIGSADGTFSSVLLEGTGARSLTGIDVLEDSVQWANRHWKEKPMQFRTADAHNLPFPDGHFDAVFCLEMLEHVFEPQQVLREMRRVLRPGGYAIVLTPTDSTLFRSVWWAWTHTKGHIWDDTHIQSFRGHALSQAVGESGLQVEREHPFLLGMLCAVVGRKH